MKDSDRALEHALRTAGHERLADALRDRRLAEQLRDAGHVELADQLEGQEQPVAHGQPGSPDPTVEGPPKDDPGTDPAQAHGQDLADLLQAKTDRQREVVEQLHGLATHDKENR